MTDLAAWLLEQIAEDERGAQAAYPGPWRYNPRKQWHGPIGSPGQLSGEEFVGAGPLDAAVCVAATGPADESQSMADAAHIARWHPARVLAECAARRQLVELHAGEHPCVYIDREWGRLDGMMWTCATLLLLAQPLADQPGFDPSWRLEQHTG